MWPEIRDYHLKRLDEALRKGEVDEGIIPVLSKINEFEEYVTRSSCYGRVSLAKEEGLIRKGRGKLLYRFHRPISIDDLYDIINSIDQGILWMNIEGTIIHVACKDLGAAEKILDIAYRAGYEESSIYSISRRGVTVEILLDEKFSIPIYMSGMGKLVSDNDIKLLLEYIHRRFYRIEKAKKNLINLLREL